MNTFWIFILTIMGILFASIIIFASEFDRRRMKMGTKQLSPSKEETQIEKPAIEAIMQDPEVQRLLSTYRKKTVLLHPRRTYEEIDFTKSKMGGMPNMNGFEQWPTCEVCKNPLDFVLQLYKSDFPDMYFPENKNLFQLFKCPNADCEAYLSLDYGVQLSHYYWNVGKDKNKQIKIPKIDFERGLGEEEIQECYFMPEICDDYPEYQDYVEDGINPWDVIEEKCQPDAFWQFLEKFCVKRATKIGGHPSWIQSSNYPICACGNQKEFFFQLAGDEPHGFFLGDGGSVYFFRCDRCENSIETRNDCS